MAELCSRESVHFRIPIFHRSFFPLPFPFHALCDFLMFEPLFVITSRAAERILLRDRYLGLQI